MSSRVKDIVLAFTQMPSNELCRQLASVIKRNVDLLAFERAELFFFVIRHSFTREYIVSAPNFVLCSGFAQTLPVIMHKMCSLFSIAQV